MEPEVVATEGEAEGIQGSQARRRTTRRRAETRRRLFAAALETFAERGFYGASVEDICERAGYTRGAFYSNFASKEELFFGLYAEQAQRLVEAVAAACGVNVAGERIRPAPEPAAAERAAAERVAAERVATERVAAGHAVAEHAANTDAGISAEVTQTALERFFAAQPDDRQWFLVNAEFTLHAVRHPQAARTLAEHRRELHARIANLLTKAFADVGLEPTMEITTFVRVLIALYENSVEQRYLEPDAARRGEFERQVVPTLLRAVSASVDAGGGKIPTGG